MVATKDLWCNLIAAADQTLFGMVMVQLDRIWDPDKTGTLTMNSELTHILVTYLCSLLFT